MKKSPVVPTQAGPSTLRNQYSSQNASQAQTSRATRLISTAAKAFETGQATLAAWAKRSKVAASMPGTSPSVASSILLMAKPPGTGPKLTVAVVWTRVGGWPSPLSAADNAME